MRTAGAAPRSPLFRTEHGTRGPLAPARSTVGPTARFTRRLLRHAGSRLTDRPFRISYWDGTSDQFGDGPPVFHLTVRSPAAAWRILRRPDPAFGDAYMAGEVEVDDL